MSDAAFKSAPYPGLTLEQLRAAAAKHDDANTAQSAQTFRKMSAEIERRERVAAGDRSVMTDGERLRHSRQTT